MTATDGPNKLLEFIYEVRGNPIGNIPKGDEWEWGWGCEGRTGIEEEGLGLGTLVIEGDKVDMEGEN